MRQNFKDWSSPKIEHNQLTPWNWMVAHPQNLEFLLDVPVKLTVELGSCKMTMQELLDLNIGAVVQLDQPANANVEVFVNHKLVARGEVVVAEDNFGIRIKEIIAKS